MRLHAPGRAGACATGRVQGPIPGPGFAVPSVHDTFARHEFAGEGQRGEGRRPLVELVVEVRPNEPSGPCLTLCVARGKGLPAGVTEAALPGLKRARIVNARLLEIAMSHRLPAPSATDLVSLSLLTPIPRPSS